MIDKEIEIRVAEILGFNDVETYRKIKEVCLYGIPELVGAMDDKRISIEKAAKIARLPQKEQRHAVKSFLLIAG